MRVLPWTLAVALVALAGCDASDTASADHAAAAAAPYQIVGPGSVRAGSCDTFTIESSSGVPQAGYNWSVTGNGYLTNASPSSALVLATAPGSYTLRANAGSPYGTIVSKKVFVTYNPRGTVEC